MLEDFKIVLGATLTIIGPHCRRHLFDGCQAGHESAQKSLRNRKPMRIWDRICSGQTLLPAPNAARVRTLPEELSR